MRSIILVLAIVFIPFSARAEQASTTYGSFTMPWAGCTFSPDGKWFATRTVGGPIQVFDLSNEGKPAQLIPSGSSGGPLDYTADGSKLVFFDDDGVRVFDMTTGFISERIKGAGSSFAPLSASLSHVVGFENERLGVWDLETRQFRVIEASKPAVAEGTSRTRQHGEYRMPLPLVSPDGNQYAVLSVRMPNISAQLAKNAAKAASEQALEAAAAFGPGGSTIINILGAIQQYRSHVDGKVPQLKMELLLLDAGTRQTLLSLGTVRATALPTLAFSTDGALVAAGDGPSVERVESVANSPRHISRSQRTPQRMAAMRVWSIKSGKEVSTLSEWVPDLTNVIFSRDGQMLAACPGLMSSILPNSSSKQEVGVWNVNTGSRLTLFEVSAPIDAMAFSADGKILAIADRDGKTTFYATRTGMRVGGFKTLPAGRWSANELLAAEVPTEVLGRRLVAALKLP